MSRQSEPAQRRLHLQIGQLGTFDFPCGTYVYTGSVRKNLEARVARHLRFDRTLRWHIDCLLTADGVRVERVVRSGLPECSLNRIVLGKMVAKGFGS